MDLVSLIVLSVVLAAAIAVFVWFARRIRRGGGGVTVGVLGATHEMLSQDRRRAGETILNRNAGKQVTEDESGDPARRAAPGASDRCVVGRDATRASAGESEPPPD